MYFQRFLKMKKILFLLNNKKLIKNKIKNKKICVVGVSRKIGVTHICLCLANFIYSVLGKKVIYIEFGKESQLLSVVGMKQVKIGDTIGYEYMGVRYVLTDNIGITLKLMSTEKAWFIIDMESLTEETQPIYDNCTNRILIGSLSPWCEKDLYSFLEKNNNNLDANQMILMVKNKTRKVLYKFKKIYEYETIDMPMINDPFSLKEENFKELINIIR